MSIFLGIYCDSDKSQSEIKAALFERGLLYQESQDLWKANGLNFVRFLVPSKQRVEILAEAGYRESYNRFIFIEVDKFNSFEGTLSALRIVQLLFDISNSLLFLNNGESLYLEFIDNLLILNSDNDLWRFKEAISIINRSYEVKPLQNL